jgi:DnaJ-class molecular chaperone
LIEVQPEFKIIDSYEVQCKRCAGTGKRPSPITGNPVNCTLCHGKRKRVKAGAIYTADFKVTYIDGYEEIIDVKGGPVGRDFPLRKKLFEKKTGMELIVVRLENKKWVRG